MRNVAIWSLAFAMVLSWSATAEAWLRWHHEDATVIGRSEAIVVGRLDKDSIKYVPHDNQGRGASWEYHATLVVSETLKGSLKDKRIAIVINYGLDPLVGGRVLKPSAIVNAAPLHKVPADGIDIIDTGNSQMGGPVLENAQKDNLWFLRHLGGSLGREPGNSRTFARLLPVVWDGKHGQAR